MKLNRAWLAATVAAVTTVAGVGTLTVVGVDRASDTSDPHVVAEMAAEQTGAIDSDTTGSPAGNAGVEQYRAGWHGGGYAHGYGRGWGRGYGRGWVGSSRWGRWGGGHYVGGRWVAGPYYGWCDGRYYACNRAWW